MSSPTPAQAAKQRYEQKRVVKTISFNRETEAQLLAFIEKQDDFSNWVKSLIAEKLTQK